MEKWLKNNSVVRRAVMASKQSWRLAFALYALVLGIAGAALMPLAASGTAAATTTTVYNPSADIGTFVGASIASIGPTLSSSGVWAALGALLVLFFVVAFIARKIKGRWSLG